MTLIKELLTSMAQGVALGAVASLIILITLKIVDVNYQAREDCTDRQQLHYKTVVEDCNDDGLFRYHDTFYVCRQVMTADTVRAHSGE